MDKLGGREGGYSFADANAHMAQRLTRAVLSSPASWVCSEIRLLGLGHKNQIHAKEFIR